MHRDQSRLSTLAIFVLESVVWHWLTWTNTLERGKMMTIGVPHTELRWTVSSQCVACQRQSTDACELVCQVAAWAEKVPRRACRLHGKEPSQCLKCHRSRNAHNLSLSSAEVVLNPKRRDATANSATLSWPSCKKKMYLLAHRQPRRCRSRNAARMPKPQGEQIILLPRPCWSRFAPTSTRTLILSAWVVNPSFEHVTNVVLTTEHPVM